jgi:hypothetical protein
MQGKPSAYFRRHCWISCDPDEHTIQPLMELYREDRFFWVSDFPHPDHNLAHLPCPVILAKHADATFAALDAKEQHPPIANGSLPGRSIEDRFDR